LLRDHIYKEDNILFKMADAAVSSGEQARLVKAFDHIEETVMGPGVHERYHAMIDEYEKIAAAW
jgi:hemerythrin-like domain-containing protein